MPGMKKIFIIIFLGAFFLTPIAANAAEFKSCCVCIHQDTSGMGQDYNALPTGSTKENPITDATQCDTHDEFSVDCAIMTDTECGEVGPPVMTTLTDEMGLQNIVLGVTIPNLHFSAPPTEVDEEGNVYIPWAGEYVRAIYNFAVVVISILAVVVLILSGAQIITSAGGPAKGAAYRRITQAIIGLFIAWGSYVVLYTINPGLTTFNSLKIKYIEPMSYAEEATPDTDVTIPKLETKVIKKSDKSGRKDCLAELSADTVGIKLKDYGLDGVSLTGKHGAYYVTVNKLMAEDLKAVFNEIAKTDYKIKAAGGVRGGGACTPGNLHLCGLAIDINPGDNPDCPAYTKQGEGKPNRKVGQYWDVAGDHRITQEEFDKCSKGEKITNIPQAVVDSFENHGFYWGGYGWNEGRSDAMHFEYHRYCF